MTNITVRLAMPDDIPGILKGAKSYHIESGFSELTYSPYKVSIMLAKLISGCGCVIVAEKNGEIIGGIAAQLMETWFGTDKIMYDFAIFIKPENRKGMLAARIIRAYVQWAREHNAKPLLHVDSKIHPEETAKFCERLGGKMVGLTYEF